MRISRLFNTLSKKIAATAIVAIAVLFPVAVSATQAVAIEGALGVANYSQGDTQYKSNVSAKVGEVVKLQVYYHNREQVGSGKVAQNLSVKIDIPSTPGKTQTQTATIKADNSNTVTDQTTVTLDNAANYLQYIPGSANWRHNTGTNDNQTWVDTAISDNVVTSGQGVVLENEQPCYNFGATVTVLARVMGPSTSVTKQVELANETGNWKTENTANPGDTLKYMITYKNVGNVLANQVVVRDNLPPYMTYVKGSTYITNVQYSNFHDTTDAIATDGIIIGNYQPGSVAYVVFQVKINDAANLPCGQTRFTNVGIAHPIAEPEYYNTAYTDVNNKCQTPPKTPVYTCDAFTLTKGDNRTVNAKVTQYTAQNGATLKTMTYDFGDGSTPFTTNDFNKTVSHTYSADGNYNVTTKLLFSVNGTDKVVASNNCAAPVSFTSTPTPPTPPTTPTELPSTGPGQVVGLFAGVTILGALAHRLFLSRRLARS